MRAAPAARSLCAPPWGWRWTKERVVEDADPYGGWETARAPRDIPREHPAPGRERGEAGVDREGGTSRTPTPTGCGEAGPRAVEFTGCWSRRGKW